MFFVASYVIQDIRYGLFVNFFKWIVFTFYHIIFNMYVCFTYEIVKSLRTILIADPMYSGRCSTVLAT